MLQHVFCSEIGNLSAELKVNEYTECLNNKICI